MKQEKVKGVLQFHLAVIFSSWISHKIDQLSLLCMLLATCNLGPSKSPDQYEFWFAAFLLTQQHVVTAPGWEHSVGKEYIATFHGKQSSCAMNSMLSYYLAVFSFATLMFIF